MSRTVLVVAAHCDDEALGCGGTIARHVAEGDAVHAVFVSDGVTSRANSGPRDVEQRSTQAKKAHGILGLQRAVLLDMPDNRLDTVPMLDLVQRLESLIHEIAPQVIYTHHYGDLNIDHRITQNAVMTACRPLPGRPVKEIYGFEVLSSTEWAKSDLGSFSPDVFIDIGDYLDIKLRAVQAYKAEMRDKPHSRSLEHVTHLARHRGYSVGLSAAEAFCALRIIR